MCPGVRLEEELRWLAHRFHGVMCSGHAQDPAFAPSSSEVAVGLFGLSVFCYAGRDWVQEEKGTTEDEMAGWHHRLDGHESE